MVQKKKTAKKKTAEKKEKKKKAHRMHQHPRATDSQESKSAMPSAEERRTQRRDEGVISRIEDITYKVLRQHEPKKP